MWSRFVPFWYLSMQERLWPTRHIPEIRKWQQRKDPGIRLWNFFRNDMKRDKMPSSRETFSRWTYPHLPIVNKSLTATRPYHFPRWYWCPLFGDNGPPVPPAMTWAFLEGLEMLGHFSPLCSSKQSGSPKKQFLSCGFVGFLLVLVLGWLAMEENWVVLMMSKLSLWDDELCYTKEGFTSSQFWCWVDVSTQFCLHAISFHVNRLEARGQPSPRNLRLTRGVVAKIDKSFSFHSRKLTWHLKMKPWKRRFLLDSNHHF